MTTTATTERPILFSGPMVRAILEGRKTQTRRLVKLKTPQPTPEHKLEVCHYAGGLAWGDSGCTCKLAAERNRYGWPGDRLWVRESFLLLRSGHYHDTGPKDRLVNHNGRIVVNGVEYKADDNGSDETTRCRMELGYTRYTPSIHMPRWASRLTLEITDIRVERLQDISESDAQSEGFEQTEFMLARRRFEILWGQINGPDSWSANPFVWVIEFKKVSE